MIIEILERQRRFFLKGETRPLEARKQALRDLLAGVSAHQQALLDALHADLRKSPTEAWLSEVGWLEGEIRHALRHLDAWNRPSTAATPLAAWPGRVRICREPMGNVLIMGPWNYPLQLALGPLVAAIAAGNTAVVKPSEHAPNTARALQRLMTAALPSEWACVIEGGTDVSHALMQQRWDLVFFTGGTETGRAIMQAAAKHLTPVILELGGKCPCIVLPDADLEVAARRILWGKTLNAGQTCVAPDHVWIDAKIAAPFKATLIRVLEEFFGADPQKSRDYGRLIHRQHWQRLTGLLDGATILHGGRSDADDLYLEPTLVECDGWDSPLMREEIFGPILPLLEMRDVDSLLKQLSHRPSPLAVYVFGKDCRLINQIVQHTRSGSVCVNDTIVQLLGRDLPFGGIGDSGTGRYHGRSGFEAFTHERVVMERSLRWDAAFRYPPIRVPLAWLKRITRWT